MALLIYRDKCLKYSEDKTKFNHDECDEMGFKLVALKQSTITEKNLNELVFRFLFLQKLNGWKGFSTYEMDAKNVRLLFKQYMGLTVNCSDETRGAFIRSWVKVVSQDIQYDMRKELN